MANVNVLGDFCHTGTGHCSKRQPVLSPISHSSSPTPRLREAIAGDAVRSVHDDDRVS
jgi:hypothetical protein